MPAVDGLARRSDDPRFACDSRRRLLQMFAEVVRGVPPEMFERSLTEARARTRSRSITSFVRTCSATLSAASSSSPPSTTGEQFPEDPREQLRQAIVAVFDSWNNERAATYRRLNGIPAELGTAVTVQRMVFGNMGERSGSGVAFTRDPTTGAPAPTATSCSTRRARTWSPASATPRPSRAWSGGCRRCMLLC